MAWLGPAVAWGGTTASHNKEKCRRGRRRSSGLYDDEIPLRYYTIDFIHLTREGHAMIAALSCRPYGRKKFSQQPMPDR
jgi:hypothetical protein